MQAKFLGSLVFSLVVAILAMQNPQDVELSFLFREYTVSLSNILIGAALLGSFISFGLGVFKDNRHKKAIRLKNKEIANLKKEIANVSSANFMKNTDNETAMNYIKESLGITNKTVVETELNQIDKEKNEPVKIKVVTKPKEKVKLFEEDPIKPLNKTIAIKNTDKEEVKKELKEEIKREIKLELEPEKTKSYESRVSDLVKLGIKPANPSYSKSGLPPELEEFKKSLSLNKKYVFPEYPGTRESAISEKSPVYSETVKAEVKKPDEFISRNLKLDGFPEDSQVEGGFLKDLSCDFSSDVKTSNDLYARPSALEGRNIMSTESIKKQFNWDSNSRSRMTIEDAIKESNNSFASCDEKMEKKGFFKSVLKPKLDGLFGEIMDD